MVYTKFENDENKKKTIPFTNGIQYRVLFGGLTAGFVRAMVECPFEYAKVKR